MTSPAKLRTALLSIGNVAEFLRRHSDVSERTVYRQRAPNPPVMRPSIARRVEQALIDEGLIRGKKETSPSTSPSPGKKATAALAGRHAKVLR